ncbi:MAG TPA: response regulator transcription factor [Longimicrobium sp.]|nr:response regulator transcription factor [Longimicrobium sp.]
MTRKPRRDDAPPSALAQLGASFAATPYARRGVPAGTETVRVILADDHALVREGLRLVLRGVAGIDVVGEAGSGASALALAQRLAPDVAVLDLDMPEGGGLGALRQIRAALPAVRVLILTMHAEQERLLELLEAGAHGYLTKEAATQELVEAIRVVAGGDVYVRPAAARLLAAAVVPQRAARTAGARFQGLSERERTVLQLVAQGYSGAEVAGRLRISTKTVAAYKQRIHDKLGLEHRTDYVRFAIEAGILGA